MAIMVTLDAATAEILGMEDGAQISMADYENAQERIRAAAKLERLVSQYNDNKEKQVRRARLLAEAQAEFPVLLAEINKRLPEGYELTNSESLSDKSVLQRVSAETNSDSADEANSGRRSRSAA